jgi:arylsulfatase A-like enzyme
VMEPRPRRSRPGWRAVRVAAWTGAAMAALASAGALPAQDPGSMVTPPTAHLVVISIDGLRPDAIDRFGLGTLQRLMAEGSHTLEATTVIPSLTLPSHASMLTGVGPHVHGITWNTHIPSRGPVPVPTVFELARAHGHHVAAFFAKAKFRHLDRPNAYDYRAVPLWNADKMMATEVIPDVIQYLQHLRPNLLFVHIGEPDYAGHVLGWMSMGYGWAVRRADAAVAEILRAAEAAYGADGFTLLVTSDHGGHGRSHGSADARDVLVPWLVYGRGVAPGHATGVRTVDTAATVLWLLGVPIPDHMDGRPVAGSLVRPAEPDHQRAREPLTSMWMKGPRTVFAR